VAKSGLNPRAPWNRSDLAVQLGVPRAQPLGAQRTMPTDESESNPPPEPKPRCTCAAVSLCDEGHRLGPTAFAWLKRKVSDVMVAIDAKGELSVRIMGDEEMAQAHQTHKGVSGTTDVLTFDLSDTGDTLDADILICFDEASRQAEAREHTVEQELLLYIVHGVLHCVGHDDHDEERARKMHDAEDEILARIGVSATYARPTLHGGGH